MVMRYGEWEWNKPGGERKRGKERNWKCRSVSRVVQIYDN